MTDATDEPMPRARTIAEVIQRLDDITNECRRGSSRLGYFPALYRKVTLRVRDRIAAGFFDDGPRMERLDVVFANRYLDAYDRYRAGDTLSESWRVAFDASGRWWPIVLQHLLLGMNAHINLDLGVAAAQVAPGAAIAALKDDFNRINTILASLVDDVVDELARVWPALRLLNRIAGRSDDVLINFSMERARDFAWRSAESLARLDENGRREAARHCDGRVALLANLVLRPGPLVGLVTKFVRLGERGTVPEIIDLLL